MPKTTTRGARRAAELIAAIATPPGRGGIGVVRLSGDGLDSLMEAILDRPAKAGAVNFRSFLAADGGALDRGLALLFRAPHSYTGEDVLELHGHGGPAVQGGLLERCLELGARLAEPGEFTMRAYLSGKLDLAQAEAVADLIGANTSRAARLAGASLRGELSRRASALAESLLAARVQLEADIDFADDDIDPDGQAALGARLDGLARMTASLHKACEAGLRWQSGVTVALIGAPNAGKSSLLNSLCGDDAAIVDPEPGTTRDIVTASCEIEGLELRIQDTAGLREGGGGVEREGMRRAHAAAEAADVVLAVSDTAAEGADPPKWDLIARNKIDLTGEDPRREGSEVWLSAKTGSGIDLLREALAERCGAAGEEPAFLARERHVRALAAAGDQIAAARAEPLPEAQAEHLRLAHAQIGSITGEVSTEDLLGEIFSSFCIGK